MKYIACFWQNDGDWHTGDYNHNPIYIFDAKNDEGAEKLAKEFALYKKSKMRGGDFSLSFLYQVTYKVVPVKDTSNFLLTATQNVIDKFASKEKEIFVPLGDYGFLIGKKDKKGKKVE